MGFRPQVTKVQNSSQATPLATDLLSMLQGQLAQGAFGTGVGPLQRQTGTALQQFINSGGAKFDISPFLPTGGSFDTTAIRDVTTTPGPRQFDYGKAASSLATMTNRRTDQAVADTREGMGIAGARFGTPGGVAEGNIRTEGNNNLAVLLSNIARDMDAGQRQDEALSLQRDQVGINRDLAVQGGKQAGQQLGLQAGQLAAGVFDQNTMRFLQSLQMGQDFGNQNIQPLLQLAAMGILPMEILAQPGVGTEIMRGLFAMGGGAAQAMAGRPG